MQLAVLHLKKQHHVKDTLLYPKVIIPAILPLARNVCEKGKSAESEGPAKYKVKVIFNDVYLSVDNLYSTLLNPPRHRNNELKNEGFTIISMQNTKTLKRTRNKWCFFHSLRLALRL